MKEDAGLTRKQFVSLEDFELLTPYEQGYVVYMEAAWDESPLEDVCPYTNSDPRKLEFIRGQIAAMLVAQDSED